MAWGTSKSNIRKKIDAGAFQKPDDTLQRGIMEAGDLAVAKILQREEEAKEEAKRKAAEARELAKDQKAKELAAKNRERKAKALAEDLGANPNNSEAIAYFTEQLFFFDDDTKAAYDKAKSDKEKGKIKFVPKEEELFLQGPDVPRDFPLTVSPDGQKPVSEFGNTGNKITASNVGNFPSKLDKDGNETNTYKTEGDQMAAIFAPISEEPAKTNTFEGLEINPDARPPVELDYQRLTTADDIDLYLGEIKSNGQTLTKDQQDVIDNRKNLLEGRRVDAAIADAVKDENNAKSALMALDAKVNQAATEDAKKTITDSYEYKAIKGFVDRFALGDAYEVPINQLKTAQDVQLEKAFIVMNKKNVGPEVMATLEEMEQAYLAKEAETKSDELRETRRGFVTQNTDELKSIANLTTFDTYTEEEVNLAKEIVESRTNADAADKLKEFKRDLVGKSKEDLIQISTGSGFTLLEKVAARAYLAAFPENFDLTEYDDVETSTIQTIIDAPNTDSKVVTQLEALVANRKLGQDVLDPKSEDYLVTYKDANGDLQTTTAKLAKDGVTYIDLSNPTNKITPAENTNVVNLSTNDELYDNVIKINQSLIKPLKEQRISMQTALVSAKKLDDLVNPEMGGDPTILTRIGGTLPQVMKSIKLETAALVTLFDQTGSKQAVFDAIDQAFSQLPQADDAAQKAVLFNAEKLKLAFAFAAAQGQTGVGLSNKDFANALTIVSSGRDYETFTKNIRSQMNQVIIKTEGMIQDFREDEAVKLLRPFDPTGQLFSGYTQSAEQYAKTRGIGDAFAWAKGSVQNTTTTLPQPKSKEERDALPIGTEYLDPKGNKRIR